MVRLSFVVLSFGGGTTCLASNLQEFSMETVEDAVKIFGGHDNFTNIPEYIWKLKGSENILYQDGNPVSMTRIHIEEYMLKKYNHMRLRNKLDIIVSPEDNYKPFFDQPKRLNLLQYPYNESFFITKTKMLRYHTTANLYSQLKTGHLNYISSGKCFRRHQVSNVSLPMIYQMEIVRTFNDSNSSSGETLEKNMKETIKGLIEDFDSKLEIKWADLIFFNTTKAYELFVKVKDTWLEIGKATLIGTTDGLNKNIIADAGLARNAIFGWNLGLRLDRLAMILYNISTITALWPEDQQGLFNFNSLVTLRPNNNNNNKNNNNSNNI